jgi:hypothetical protein
MAFARSLSKKHHIISTISKTRGVLAIYILFLDPPESINTIVAKIDTSSFTMPFLMEKETLPMLWIRLARAWKSLSCHL